MSARSFAFLRPALFLAAACLCAACFVACATDADVIEAPAGSDAASDVPQDAAADVPPVDTAADTPDVKPDTGPTCPGGAGCVCKTDKDCPGSACVDSPKGRFCAAPCSATGTCPAGSGQVCKNVAVDGKTIKLCAPRFAHLCDPCTKSSQCTTAVDPGYHCVAPAQDNGASGWYCAAPCSGDLDCLPGYSCKSAAAVEGGTVGKHCVPSDGQCVCNEAARANGLTTTCFQSAKTPDGKLIGTCNGTRKCSNVGLTSCSAAVPAPEACDGLDNDCDGGKDEDTCNDASACTTDSCEGGGGCKHAPVVCDDKNLCTDDKCDPKTGCDFPANVTPCDDASACTQDDACTGGACKGQGVSCDDGNVCTSDSCDPKLGCKHAPNTAPCSDGNACSQNDTCAQSTCSGQAVVCDDKNPCSKDACDPASGCTATAADGLACDDGNFCTTQDVCLASACTATAVNCDDGSPCTSDSCDPKKGCVYAPLDGPVCSDGNGCTTGDVCAKGKCQPGEAVDCQDTELCTSDLCSPAEGKCIHTMVADGSPCNDGSICTGVDTCSKGACVGSSPLVCDDKNPCSKDTCDPKKGCQSEALTGVSCTDNNPCTDGEACKNGTCGGAKPVVDGTPCGDGLQCSSGKCS